MSQRASTGCVLDASGCLDLESILTAFGAPISEEQAWALCYTTIQCFLDLKDEDKSKVSLSPSLTHVILHKDGYVHEETLLPTSTATQGRIVTPSCRGHRSAAPGSAGCCLAHPARAGVASIDGAAPGAAAPRLLPPPRRQERRASGCFTCPPFRVVLRLWVLSRPHTVTQGNASPRGGRGKA